MRKIEILFTVLVMIILISACTVSKKVGEDDASSDKAKEENVVSTHEHEYSQVTCTEASRCSCGEKQGIALGHELVDGTCSVCGIIPEYNVGNLMILGDSYSTFEGYLPDGNATWYKDGGSDKTDVTSVDQTWWRLFVKNTKANLVLNERTPFNCWHGTN